ncbi:MAG: glucuronate isomerase, partial [Chitinophagaceae bacterium]|nr:glucuronate isomerase [Chitinophagaceae bacterium]
MKPFLDENFLLQNKTAITLYHDYAKAMPIIDYHNHLIPEQIATDKQFENLTQIWLYGDHYKWRAMRANGVSEDYITGKKSDWEKFEKWAETVPYTLRNPLYHWTHLELQRYFDVHEILNASSAKKIYDECSEKLRSKEYSVRNLLRKMNVKIACTTDDPTDDLLFHKQIKEEGFEISVLPAFRPDKAMAVEDVRLFNQYIKKLEAAANISISSFNDYLTALKKRHDFFATMGCSVSDHGLEEMYAEDFSDSEINSIFNKIYSGHSLNLEEQKK